LVVLVGIELVVVVVVVKDGVLVDEHVE